MRAQSDTLIDISMDRRDSTKAFAYLDGPDARLFRRLRAKLGSDQSAQSAIILEGLINKLEGSKNSKKVEEIKLLFPKIVGVSYGEVQKIALPI
jgi:hypothetical protein